VLWLGCLLAKPAVTAAGGKDGDSNFMLYAPSGAEQRLLAVRARLPGSGAEQGGFPSAFTVEISDDPSFAARVKIAEWREPKAAAGERLPFLMAAGNGASAATCGLR
jgi:hypothetical protein